MARELPEYNDRREQGESWSPIFLPPAAQLLLDPARDDDFCPEPSRRRCEQVASKRVD